MKRLLSLCLILYCAVSSAFDINPKFGSVSMEELTMDSYAPDTSAVAVYLYSDDTVETAIEMGSFATYNIFRRRIKVLKDEGKDYADFTVSWNKADKESVSGIKVTTYNLVDGKIKATKMERKYIFEQNVTGDIYTTKFSAQDVIVGSVIEVEYTLESRYFKTTDELRLQKRIPVVRGQANIIYPEHFRYQKYQRGLNRAEYSQTTETRVYGSLSYQQIVDKYEMKDMPAAPTEDEFCWCPSFFADAIVYDLKSINFPGVLSRTFGDDWSKVDRIFAESEMYAGITRKNPYLKSDIDALAPQLEGASDEDKINAMRELVRSKVKWNKERSFDVYVQDALKKGTANDAEMNCLLGSALEYLGFTVSPTFLLLKNHGILVSFQISTFSFSKMILQICKDGKTWYVDASDSYGSLNCLPPSYLVEEARVVRKDQGEWVDLSELVKSMDYLTVDGTVGEDGEFTYSVNESLTNHEAWTFRRLFGEDYDEEKRVERLESLLNSEIDEISYTGLTEWVNKAGFKATASRKFESYDKTVYINPYIRIFHIINAFEQTERTLPVEFKFPESITYNAIIHIPEGYEVVEMPRGTNATMNTIGSFVRTSYMLVDAQTIRVSYMYRLGNVTCPAEDYTALRNYWITLTNIYKDRIVIRKK